MTACTQRGCTGAIVDGYCDVCGSPADAGPFIPAEAAASARSPAPAEAPGLTTVGRGSGFPPEPKSEGLNTACMQPGCTGAIVDGYCDVCGSPAGAVPFIPAEAAASPSSPSSVDEPGLTAVGPGSETSPEPKNGGVRAACMQPGCTGTMVDGYCDVCGSPVGAGPLVPAELALSASPAPAARPGLTAVRRGVMVAAVLFLLGCAVVLYQVAPGLLTDGSRPSITASSAPTTIGTDRASPGGVSSSADQSPALDPRKGSAVAIQLEDLPGSARPFETVRIQGTYHGGADAFLRVQRWEAGEWLAFPVPAKTDQSGKFTAYLEFGQPGRYQLRVLHLGSGVTSKPFVLVIRG
jgi:hypothetical protein